MNIEQLESLMVESRRLKEKDRKLTKDLKFLNESHCLGLVVKIALETHHRTFKGGEGKHYHDFAADNDVAKEIITNAYRNKIKKIEDRIGEIEKIVFETKIEA